MNSMRACALSLAINLSAQDLLQGKGKKVSKCEEAAGTVGSMAASNAPNQEAFRAAGALPLLLELVLSADRSIKASQNGPAECFPPTQWMAAPQAALP